MEHKILSKGEVNKLVDELIKAGRVVGVAEKEPLKFHYTDLKSSSQLRLDYDVTVIPPKKYLQPQREDLVKFTTRPKIEVSAVIEAAPLTIVGVHPYDMAAINQMDKVFAEDNKDANYLEKRSKTVIIGCDPVKASKWSFWAWMGAMTVNKGFDLWLTDLGDKYFVQIGSDNGKKILGRVNATNVSKDDEAKFIKVREDLKKLCSPSREVKEKNIYKRIKDNYENAIWEKRAETCYSCGSCNLVCPTCYCFDVREEMELNLSHGRRTRIWDGCLLTEFASVGSGENFREERSERYRHRLFRKTVYMVDKVGELACVGCGRCSSVCLPDIADPVKVINELTEGK